MNQATKKTQEMVKLALFAGIIVVLAMTPLGYLPLGVLRPKKGAALGGLFGLTSLLVNTFTPNPTSFVFSPFYSLGEIGGNGWSLVICFVPRILVGVAPYFVYKGMKKLIKSDAACLTVSGFVGSMVNTLLVMNMIYLFFGESWAAVKGIAADVIYATILGIIATNGIPEAIVAALITAAVGKVLLAMERK